MEISEIISPERVISSNVVISKKAALESLAGLIASADPGLTQSEVFESLIAREKLGSTGLGHGIALPHGRRKGGNQTIGAFLRLDDAVPYDAIDQKPVDLFFALLVPEESTEEHLQILAKLAKIFSDPSLVNRIRSCDSEQSLFTIISDQ
jgi:PTS system nitrogen regulatory IIA component